MPDNWTDKGVQRRIINFSAFRLDGLADLLPRAKRSVPGNSVFDIGCNRGAVCYDFVLAGAGLVHGCDNGMEADGTKVVDTANKWFADIRSVDARFEHVDLSGGPAAVSKAFGKHYRDKYDFVLMLAVYHKLRRVMPLEKLLDLVDHFAQHTGKFFVWRGGDDQRAEFEPVLTRRNFKLVHYSSICEVVMADTPDAVPQPCAVWTAQN
jgi:SAM-dependent methyltransferase